MCVLWRCRHKRSLSGWPADRRGSITAARSIGWNAAPPAWASPVRCRCFDRKRAVTLGFSAAVGDAPALGHGLRRMKTTTCFPWSTPERGARAPDAVHLRRPTPRTATPFRVRTAKPRPNPNARSRQIIRPRHHAGSAVRMVRAPYTRDGLRTEIAAWPSGRPPLRCIGAKAGVSPMWIPCAAAVRHFCWTRGSPIVASLRFTVVREGLRHQGLLSEAVDVGNARILHAERIQIGSLLELIERLARETSYHRREQSHRVGL